MSSTLGVGSLFLFSPLSSLSDTEADMEDPNGTMGVCEEWLGWITKYEEEYCQEGYDCNGVCGGDDWSCMQEDCPVGYDCNGVCGGNDFSCFDDMGPAITNGCDLPSSNIQGHLAITTSGDILYNTPEDIGGFQFVMDGATEAATITFLGGDASTAGLNISSNYNAVNELMNIENFTDFGTKIAK